MGRRDRRPVTPPGPPPAAPGRPATMPHPSEHPAQHATINAHVAIDLEGTTEQINAASDQVAAAFKAAIGTVKGMAHVRVHNAFLSGGGRGYVDLTS